MVKERCVSNNVAHTHDTAQCHYYNANGKGGKGKVKGHRTTWDAKGKGSEGKGKEIKGKKGKGAFTNGNKGGKGSKGKPALGNRGVMAVSSSVGVTNLSGNVKPIMQSLFDMNAPLVKAAPRQHYGIDFYGLMSGDILIMVDLFTREALLQWLPSREQENVARTILRRVVFERGVPLSLRLDNAPELMKGVVKKICSYLNIQQIVTVREFDVATV